MDPHTALTIATETVPFTLGLFEYLVGQGVLGALLVLFVIMWRQAVADVRKKYKEIAEAAKAHKDEIKVLQERRLDESKVSGEKRLDLQGKLIDTMNSATAAVSGLEKAFNALRERKR